MSRHSQLVSRSHLAPTLNTSFYRGYEYDELGRIGKVLGEGVRRTYSYDNLGRLTGRLTQASCTVFGEDADLGLLTGCTQTTGNETFSYDQVGNRTDLGGVTGTGNRIQSFNGITFAHDADGNVTQKYKAGVYNRQYWWSAEARLDSAQQDSWSKVKYDYDALGRPVRKWRGDPNAWVFDRLWVYDGDHRLLSLDPSMNRVEEYAYAPGIDRPIATIRGNTGVGAVGYHVQDELGNIIGILESNAYVSQTNSYDAWGTPTETGIAYNNQLKWKGLKWEGDVISLYYMRNRWYDYETGRFMSEDPIGLEGGINLYAFAGNDPVNGSDPLGLDPCSRPVDGVSLCDPVLIGVGGPVGFWPLSWAWWRDNFGGRGSGGNPYNDWERVDLGGVGGGGRGTGSSNVSADANRRIQALPGCAAEHSGLNALLAVAGAGAVYAGWPNVPKRFETRGTRGGKSSAATSRASTFFRKWVTADLPFRVRAPTWERPLARTTHVGTVLGRYTPVLGWGMLGVSAYQMGSCVSEAN